jgi:hypothetical protein
LTVRKIKVFLRKIHHVASISSTSSYFPGKIISMNKYPWNKFQRKIILIIPDLRSDKTETHWANWRESPPFFLSLCFWESVHREKLRDGGLNRKPSCGSDCLWDSKVFTGISLGLLIFLGKYFLGGVHFGNLFQFLRF